MKKIVFCLILVGFTIINAYSQDSYIKHRLNFKLSHAKNPVDMKPIFDELDLGNFRVEGNYGVLNCLEIGGYSGYGLWAFESNTARMINNTIKSGRFSSSNVLFYGVNANFHFLPFLVKQNEFRFDLYLSGKFGGFNIFAPEYSLYKGPHSDYALFLGGAFYLWKHLGFFAEYGYSKKFTPNIKASSLRYGLTLKFKR